MNIRINLYKSAVVAGGIAAPYIAAPYIALAPASRPHRAERRRMQLPDHLEKIAVQLSIRSKVSGRVVRMSVRSRIVCAPEARRADEFGYEARVPAFALLASLSRMTETRSHHS